MKRPSVDELREHRDVLAAFERDYRHYIDSLKRSGLVGGDGAAGARRAELLRRAARAQRARDASGQHFALTPPPMFGGPPLHALAQQIVAHETPAFSANYRWSGADMVLDGLVGSLGALDDRIVQAEKTADARAAPREIQRHLPMLWGRLSHFPRWVTLAADTITVVGFLLAVAYAVGRFVGSL